MKSIVFRSMKILNKNIVNFQNSLINGVNGLIDLTTRGNGFQLLGSQSPQHLSIHSGSQTDLQTIFDSIFLFAAPKKKVSPGKKRRKHFLYYPDKVNWISCKRCGEPKLRHRMCKNNMNICAMRDDEYEEYKQNQNQSSN